MCYNFKFNYLRTGVLSEYIKVWHFSFRVNFGTVSNRSFRFVTSSSYWMLIPSIQKSQIMLLALWSHTYVQWGGKRKHDRPTVWSLHILKKRYHCELGDGILNNRFSILKESDELILVLILTVIIPKVM